MADKPEGGRTQVFENIGRGTVHGVEQFGYGAELLGQSLYWVFMGRARRQRVRLSPIFAEAFESAATDVAGIRDSVHVAVDGGTRHECEAGR